MSYTFNPGAGLGLLAGLATLALGLAVLRVRPRRRDAVAFAAFAATWGLFTVLLHASLTTADVSTLKPWVYAYVAVGTPLFVPLLYFAATYPTPRHPLARNPVAAATVAVPAVLALLLYAAEPSLFVEGFAENPEPPHRPIFGSIGTIASVVSTQFAFVAALALLFHRRADARDATERSQLTLLAAGFLVYVSYRASDVLHAGLLLQDVSGWPWQLVLRLAAAGTALAATGAGLVVAYRDGTAEREAPWPGLLWAAGLVPLAVGLLEVFLLQGGIAGFRTDGLWRMATVGLFAYALARTRLFDLDLRVRQLAGAACYVLLPAGLVLAMWAGAGSTLAEAPAPATGASLGLAVVGVGLTRVGLRWADRATPLADEAYRSDRRAAAYKTAVREVFDLDLDPQATQDRLAALGEHLDVDPDQHREMLERARAEVDTRPSSGPLDRLEVTEELGQGGFARALLARDPVLDRKVVVKQPLRSWVTTEADREAFLREARLAAGVQHPNVVTLYEVRTDHDPPLLVFEHVEGGSLRERLDREGPLEARRGLEVAEDVLAGLRALHEAGIVHRDVKPDNVLLTTDGRAVLADLGAAQPSEEGAEVTLGAAEQGVGALGYMSPEQTRGDEAGPRSDVYSAGALLYRALTGEAYVDLANVPDAIARQRVREREPRLPRDEVPAPVERVLRQALAKAPEDRYEDAEAMRAALAAALEELEAASPVAE